MTVQVSAPTPEQLVAELLQRQRAEAEEKHKREVAAWEAAQRAKFEEEVRAEKERIRRQYGYDPLSILLAQRYEAQARRQFESALAERKSMAWREFEESWRRFEETVKPSLLESARFWIGLGYPEYAGRYEPIQLPKGAVITGIKETPEGLKIEYKVREQLEAEKRRLEEERKQLERIKTGISLEEYRARSGHMGKYKFQSALEAGLFRGEQWAIERYEEIKRQQKESEEFWTKMGYPELAGKYAPIQLPEGAVITRIEETSEGLKVEYKTQEQLEAERQIEQYMKAMQAAQQLIERANTPASIYGRQLLHSLLSAGTQQQQPETEKLPSVYEKGVFKQLEKLQEVTNTGRQILYENLSLARVEKQIMESKEFWESIGIKKYAGKYAPIDQLKDLTPVDWRETAGGEPQVVFMKDGVFYVATFKEEERQLKVEMQLHPLTEIASKIFWTEQGYHEYAGKYPPIYIPQDMRIARVEETSEGLKIYLEPAPKIKTLSQMAYEWAEGINIPIVEEIAKFFVGAFSFAIDQPAYAIARGLGYLTGVEMPPAQWPPVEDIAYSSGFLLGAVSIALLSGGIAGIPATTVLKGSAIAGGVTAATTTAFSLATGQPITPGQLITATAKGIAYGGLYQAGLVTLGKAYPAIVSGTAIGKLAQVGYAGAFGAGVGYIETGDIGKALVVGGLSAMTAALILFGVQPAYHEIKARLGKTVRLEPAGTTVGMGGREARVYEAYLKDLDMRLRVVEDLTEKPVGTAGVTREGLIQEYINREIATAHATLQFKAFAKPGEDILLKGFPEQAAGFRRDLQLYHFYSAPGDEKTITVYGAYMGLSGDYTGARVVVGGQPGVVATTKSYISPGSLMKPGETVTEYLMRVSLQSGKVMIAPETVLGWSAERQVITPAAYERFGVQLPGSYFHVDKVLPQTFEIVQYPAGLLGKIPILRTLLAKYFDFRVVLGEFKPVTESLAVKSAGEATAVARALAGVQSASLSSQPIIFVSPATFIASAAAVSGSVIAASTIGKSASIPMISKAISIPHVYSAPQVSPGSVVPSLSSISLAATKVISTPHAPSLSPISTAVSAIETPVAPGQLSSEKIIEHMLATSVESLRPTIMESISSLPSKKSSSLEQSQASGEISSSRILGFKFVPVLPSIETTISSILSSSAYESKAQPTTQKKPRHLGEWSFPVRWVRFRELGFIYERERPITGAEEQIKQLKKNLKIDPHIFLEAPALPGKKAVKAEVRQIEAGALRRQIVGLRKVHVVFSNPPERSALGKRAAFIMGAPDLQRQVKVPKAQIKMETPDFRKEIQKIKASMLSLPLEQTRKRKKKKR